MLVVGFTPQYKELGELYDRYSSQGFVILGKLEQLQYIHSILPMSAEHTVASF